MLLTNRTLLTTPCFYIHTVHRGVYVTYKSKTDQWRNRVLIIVYLDKTPWLFANTRLSQPRLQSCSESLAGFPECDTALKPVVIHESLHYFVYDALLFPALRRCVVLRASIVTKLRDAQHTNCKIIFVKANDKIVELVKSFFFNPFKEIRHAQYYDLSFSSM